MPINLSKYGLPKMHVRSCGGVRSFYLGEIGDVSRPPLFTISVHPAPEFRMTQEEWDDATALCLEARVKGRWRGDDILHPIPWEEGYDRGI